MPRPIRFTLNRLAYANLQAPMIRFLARLTVRLLLAALFLLAGTLHLRKPEFFLPIMPPAIPLPISCILISGVFELLGGLGLLVPLRSIQILTGWGLTLLLLAVFPANIYMAIANVKINGFPPASLEWLTWLRLPLQPVLMAGVLWVTGIWPVNCIKQTQQMPQPKP